MFPSHIASVPKRDESQEALREVERITGSEPVRGETLLRSRKLKRKLREANIPATFGRPRHIRRKRLKRPSI
jgi:hypothetical protein